jgi:hypothetical protein
MYVLWHELGDAGDGVCACAYILYRIWVYGENYMLYANSKFDVMCYNYLIRNYGREIQFQINPKCKDS